MIFGNVPNFHARRLHALVGILAATAAFPTACSGDDFEGCEASRTCPPKGGEAGTGGEGGDDTGGSSGAGGSSGSSEGGTAGTSGTDDGGESGTGGSGGTGDEDTEPPTIVTFTPSDGDVDIERDITVTVELSEAIDASTVTATSVVLTGPDGDVAGTLSVDDNVISFTPEKKMYLLGDYTFTIDETIADLAGNTLAESEGVGFRVRDGRWSEPTYPFGETVPRIMGPFGRNSVGDIILSGSTTDADAKVWAAVYGAAEDNWARPETVHSMAAIDLFAFDVAIDDQRRAALTWGGYSLDGGGWFGFTEEAGWTDAGAQTTNSYVTVTDRGQGVAVWQYASDVNGQVQNIPTGEVESASRIAPAGRIVYEIVPSLERSAVITRIWPSGENTIHVTWFDPTVGWGTPSPLATAPDINQITADSDEAGNIVVLWTQGAEIWSRIYERAQDRWIQATRITTLGSTETYVGSLDVAAGNAIVTFGVQSTPVVWGAYYQSGAGWIARSIVEITDAATGYAWQPSVTIDPRGNALVVWGEEFGFRRYLSNEGWQELTAGLDFMCRGGAVAPDGTVGVMGRQSIGTDLSVATFIRFE